MAKVLYWRNTDDYVPDSLKAKGKFKNPDNKVYVEGTIVKDICFEYEFNKVKYFKTVVAVKRFNSTEIDRIPIILSESMMQEKLNQNVLKKYVKVYGEYQSYNYTDSSDQKHVDLYVFVKYIEVFDNESRAEKSAITNAVYLRGRVCKYPSIRGKSNDVVNIILEVPRARDISNHYDYINCSSIGNLSTWTKRLKADDMVEVFGTVQSRKYQKRNSDGTRDGEYKTAYNVVIKGIFKCKKK